MADLTDARVLITGGTGFIGSALAQRLLAANVAVDVLTRDRQRAERQFAGHVRAVESLSELHRDARSEPPAVIVNLAGKNLGSERWNARVKREIVSSRVETTRHVLDYMKRASPRPRLLISGSAVGYYGARGDELLDENSAAGSEYQSQLCAEWEAVASAAAHFGVRMCLSRTGVVLGPDGGVLSGLRPLFQKGMGAVVGSGKQWISWIHLEDLLDLFCDFMSDESLSGAFNNTAPNPVTHREFVRTLGRVLRRPVILRVPDSAYRLLVGEMARLHLTGQRVIPMRHLERGFRYRYPTLQAALGAVLEPR